MPGNKLKFYHILLALLIGFVSLLFFTVYGWAAFATITARSGMNGHAHVYYDLSAADYIIYNTIIALTALWVTTNVAISLMRRDHKKLNGLYLHFAVFLIIITGCELYMQSRLTGKG